MRQTMYRENREADTAAHEAYAAALDNRPCACERDDGECDCGAIAAADEAADAAHAAACEQAVVELNEKMEAEEAAARPWRELALRLAAYLNAAGWQNIHRHGPGEREYELGGYLLDGTGSAYISTEWGSIRISDHPGPRGRGGMRENGEAHEAADLSVDPEGATEAEAEALIDKWIREVSA
jgi:hypothetical protein